MQAGKASKTGTSLGGQQDVGPRKNEEIWVIDFQTMQGRFHYRTIGVAYQDEHVLLHRMDDADYWVLPGGRVEFGETSREALKREMREELGQEIEVGRLLWIVESFLEENGQRVHGIGLYYAMSFSAPSALPLHLGTFEVLDGTTRLSFAWHPLNHLATLIVYPPFLRQHLLSPPAYPLHLLDRRTSSE